MSQLILAKETVFPFRVLRVFRGYRCLGID
jgi:hypothetical protein